MIKIFKYYKIEFKNKALKCNKNIYHNYKF